MNAHDHADDELLSALIDGPTEHNEAAVLADCPACTERLAALRAATAAVAAPVPPPPAAHRDAAIATALAAIDDQPTPATPLARRPRPSRSPAWLLPAAAVLAMLVGGVALVTRGSDEPTAVTLDAPGEEAQPGAAAAGGGFESDSAGFVVDGGDLGAIDDSDELRQAVESFLDQPRQGSLSLRSSGEPSEVADDSLAPESAPESHPAIDRCDAAVIAGDPDVGVLVFIGTVLWQETPAIVLAYEADDGRRLTRRVYALEPDCSILTVVSFTR